MPLASRVFGRCNGSAASVGACPHMASNTCSNGHSNTLLGCLRNAQNLLDWLQPDWTFIAMSMPSVYNMLSNVIKCYLPLAFATHFPSGPFFPRPRDVAHGFWWPGWCRRDLGPEVGGSAWAEASCFSIEKMARSSWPDVGRQSIWDDFLIPTNLFGLFWAGLKHVLYLQCFIPKIRCSVMIKMQQGFFRWVETWNMLKPFESVKPLAIWCHLCRF